jgi:hypothetical protein
VCQDLRKTKLLLWADNPHDIVNKDTRAFFDGFSSNIEVRHFNYTAEVQGTVLEGDAYFASEAAIKASVPKGKPASYSDLVRYILLHNYGGLWCDTAHPGACSAVSLIELAIIGCCSQGASEHTPT